MPAQDSFWSSLLELGDRLGAGAGTLALLAAIAATVCAIHVINLRRRYGIVTQRLAALETRLEQQTADPSAPSLNVFCQQLMNALGMELPGAVSARMSADDPARFIRALTIYTRAQRRRLLALYRQAESLREVLHPEGVPLADHCHVAERRSQIRTHPEADPHSRRLNSQELELVG